MWSQDAKGLRGPRYPPNSSGHASLVPQAGRGWQPEVRGRRRLNHLSLCSPQLNGSGQLKMSSHCLSAQMLAPPPPGLPRLALPPATKPTSEGGSTSPTSPCKHSGSGARGRAGVPEGPPPLPSPTAGVGGSGLAWWVLASLVGPQIEAWVGAAGLGPRGARADLGEGRGKSAVYPDWPSGVGSPSPTLHPQALLRVKKQLAIDEDLQLVG